MPSLEAGKRLADRYLLQDRLGDGGHAEVWAALDHDGVRVALKFLHLRTCTADEALQVLRHEARMAQRLDHPGVLRAGDPVRDGELVFLPIEYAAGGDASRLRGAPWQRVVPVLIDVARVLEHAHSRGVVHRDVKPGNVLFGADGTVRVTDFGTSARTGCCDALAAGSPFSASPQQLRGEAATTADDVYGLGALAYELLTRYPPFYPHFDATRVQLEDPAPLQPVYPAPAPLCELVAAMLGRDARDRPDIAQVLQVLETCRAADQSGADAVIVEAKGAAAAAPVRPRRTGWWLAAAAAAAGAAVLYVAPDPADVARVVAAATEPPPAPVRSVADAVVMAPAAAEPPAVPATTPVQVASLDEELGAGAAALVAWQPAQARAAFQRALVLAPGHADAMAGLAAVSEAERLLTGLGQATRIEAQGDLPGAARAYETLLAGRADFAPAREALARVRQRQRDQQFEQHLAAGADALRHGDVAAAQRAYQQAAAIHADEPRLREGQQSVAGILRDRRNGADLAAGVALERQEQWVEALAHYRQVLERDDTLRFAQDGRARSERRAELDRELQDYLDRPDRLTAAAVRQAADRALARGEASAAESPRLQAQLRQLRGTLQALTVQVPVSLLSDNSTRVSVAQVGELGSFEARELKLPPGHYTVIGQREGFRDVRLELHIAPGQPAARLSVQCTERI